MARFNLPPPELLQQVATELGDALPRSPLAHSLGSAGIDEVEIAETTETWLLPLDRVLEGAPLASALVPINRWHHQLKAKGHALGYATSLAGQEMGAGQHLAEIADDWQLSFAFDRAVEAIDRHHPGEETIVRLISSPAFRLWALHGSGPEIDELYVLSSAVQFAPDLGAPLGIPRLSSAEFMRQLAAAPYEQGLVEG